MPRTKSLLSILGAIAVAGLSACGNSGSGEVVAQVAGVGAITKASLDHWMRAEVVIVHELVPRHPAPKGLIPDPPHYTACIAYLRVVSKRELNKFFSTSGLRERCKQQERELRETTLDKLISWEWTIGIGKALGIRVTNAEVRQRLSSIVQGGQLYGKDLARYLRLTGQSFTDILLRSQVQLYEVKVSEKTRAFGASLPRNLTEQERQKTMRLATALLQPNAWIPKTSCRKGYVVAACRQYAGNTSQPQ